VPKAAVKTPTSAGGRYRTTGVPLREGKGGGSAWAERQGFESLLWQQPERRAAMTGTTKQREQLLTAIVRMPGGCWAWPEQAQRPIRRQRRIAAAAACCGRLIAQDVEGKPEGVANQAGDGKGPAGECGGPGECGTGARVRVSASMGTRRQCRGHEKSVDRGGGGAGG